MSTHTEFGPWSIEEGELLENIDVKVHLVSTSSSCPSTVSGHKEIGRTDAVDMTTADSAKAPPAMMPETRDVTQSRQSLDCAVEAVDTCKPAYVDKLKLYSSCNDLSMMPTNHDTKSILPESEFKRSASCDSLRSNGKHRPGKYDHVQSKIKQYFKDARVPSPRREVVVRTVAAKAAPKEDYLEEINKRLTRELDEKNTLLMKLQENYEQLLMKYAEAQNRIDLLRLKAMSWSPERSCRGGIKPKSSRTSIRVPLNSLYPKEDDGRCQKAIVAPFMKADEALKGEDGKALRPQSLPIDCGLTVLDRDLLKATTPTDSEGVSSVITSMSGHSKILNTLDEEGDKKPKDDLKFQNPEFLLENREPVSDPYDKVKNWQNSLPPLELIETPETTLYDLPGSGEPNVSPSTNYNDIPDAAPQPPDPPLCDWHEDFSSKNKAVSQAVMKKYLRTLSLPGSLSKRNLMSLIYKRKNHHTIDLCVSNEAHEAEYKMHHVITEESAEPGDVPATCIIRKQRKKPPFLRSASLPVYDYDSPKSSSFRNDVFIPPLDLDSLTISDDVTSPDLGYNLTKTSPSFVTSRGDSADCSFQTLQSINSCKATVSDISDGPFARPRPTFHKSTSITPDRSKEMIFPTVYEMKDTNTYPIEGVKDSAEEPEGKSWCNVCGETILGPYKAALYQGGEPEGGKAPPRRPKHPFNRSVSFNSDTLSPSFCFHEGDASIERVSSPRSSFHRRSHDSLDQFDMYANNLKTRSQMIMKALTAHVNNS